MQEEHEAKSTPVPGQQVSRPIALTLHHKFRLGCLADVVARGPLDHHCCSTSRSRQGRSERLLVPSATSLVTRSARGGLDQAGEMGRWNCSDLSIRRRTGPMCTVDLVFFTSSPRSQSQTRLVTSCYDSHRVAQPPHPPAEQRTK
jgi:hypothetical protein